MKEQREDTIVAIATPPGEGGIGIIRLSGSRALEIGEELFRPYKSRKAYKSHRVYIGVVSGDQGEEIDEVIFIYMQAPHSYTGEDVVEIQGHGGPYLLECIVKEAISRGARMAQPGEFTRRAFLSGRIDLTQAEAVAQVITAGNEAELKLAAQIREGWLSREISELRQGLKEATARLVVRWEFPEEETVSELKEEREIIRRAQKKINELIHGYLQAEKARNKKRVVLAGGVNVGKSSLFNRLLVKERALVHERPGTTRDYLEAELNLEGQKFILVDTAGWRVKSEEEEERLGMNLALREIAAADIIIRVLDLSREEKEIENLIPIAESKKTLIVLNKKDIAEEKIEKSYRERFGAEALNISAQKGWGIEELKRKIKECGKEIIPEHALGTLRQKLAAEAAEQHLGAALNLLGKENTEELAVYELECAEEKLKQIIGVITSEEILAQVFSSFCIGK